MLCTTTEAKVICPFKIFMLLYADGINIFANTQEPLQNSLDLLIEYYNKWNVTINVSKIKVMVFQRWCSASEYGFLL